MMGQTRKLSVGLSRRKYSRMAVKIWQATYVLEEKTYKFESDDEDNCQNAVENGNLCAKMTFDKDIPCFLPMMGKKVQVYNRRITKICINCY